MHAVITTCNFSLFKISDTLASSPYRGGKKTRIGSDLTKSPRQVYPSPSKRKPRASTPAKYPVATSMDTNRNHVLQPRKSRITFLEQHPAQQILINYSSARTFYNISQEEQQVTLANVQREIELDSSFHEAQELFTESRVEPYFVEETKYPVNNHIVEIVLETLMGIGIKDPDGFVAEWSSHRFYGIANFWEACQEYNQEYRLGSNQIVAYLNLLNDKFYSVTTLQSNWSTLKIVAKEIGFKINKIHESYFRTVCENSRELKDDKLPVSRTLLHELLESAKKMLIGI